MEFAIMNASKKRSKQASKPASKALVSHLLAVLLFLPPVCADAGGFDEARENMVRQQIRKRGIANRNVLAAMKRVPRHLFVPEELRSNAYEDRPLPIGEGQTISQPYIVALMTEKLGLTKSSKVLEIGTGSGYQAAILSETAGEVLTVEIKAKLHKRASRILRPPDYANVKTRHGDGYFGWEEHAPFDAAMITAAVNHIPPPLLRQLKDGGKLILPLGNPFSFQHLTLVTKKGGDYTVRQITGVLFVPMTGEAMKKKK